MKASAWKTGLATVALMALGASASAATIVIDDTSGNNQTDVSGTMNYSVTGAAGAFTFSFSMLNSTTLGNTRITGIAFDLLSGAVQTGHTAPDDWGYTPNTGTLPGEALAFDSCFWSGSNCGSGGNSGILEGVTLGGFSVSFTLADLTLSASEVEALFTSGFNSGALRACVRVISIPTTGTGSGNGAGSDVACYGGQTGDDDDDDDDDDQLPEPGTLALLGLGLMGLGLSRRRRV